MDHYLTLIDELTNKLKRIIDENTSKYREQQVLHTNYAMIGQRYLYYQIENIIFECMIIFLCFLKNRHEDQCYPEQIPTEAVSVAREPSPLDSMFSNMANTINMRDTSERPTVLPDHIQINPALSNYEDLYSSQYSVREHISRVEFYNNDIDGSNHIYNRDSRNEIINLSTEIIQYEPSMNGRECPISLETFVEGEEIRRILQCQHFFKKDNIDRWLEINDCCPICRYNIYIQIVEEI